MIVGIICQIRKCHSERKLKKKDHVANHGSLALSRSVLVIRLLRTLIRERKKIRCRSADAYSERDR